MKSLKHLLVASIGFALMFLAFGSRLSAQVTTADIIGTVTDQTGAVVSNGTATATNTGTGAVSKSVIGGDGGFSFTLLQIGTYKVQVQAKGFKGYITEVTLAAGDRARVNAQLSIGQEEQTVTVEATTPALQADDSTVGTLITSELTQDLPLNGRNVTNLVQLSAGVTVGLSNGMNSGTRPDDRRMDSGFAANGQSDEINNNMIDGMDNNERFIGSVGVRPSIDAIQEVKVLTNLYTAEISRSGGGVVDLITKSGTNTLHGSLYEFVRNDKFDAKDYFALPTQRKPELRQNQFGGSIGGPIIKDKSFFFGDYEGFRLVQGITQTNTVPTAYEEQHPGDFTDIGGTSLTGLGLTPGVIGKNYLALFPAPNTTPTSGGSGGAPPLNNFTYTAGKTQVMETYDAKGDYRFSAKDSMYVRYTYNRNTAVIPGNYPSVKVAGLSVNPGQGPYSNFAGPALDIEHSGAVGFTHMLSSNLILELKAQYMRLDNLSKSVNDGLAVATAFGFPCNSTSCINLPGDEASSGLTNVATFAGIYGTVGDADYVPLLDLNNTYQYMPSLSWIHGQHSVKVGMSVVRRQGSPGQSAHPRGQLIENGDLTGNPMEDLIADYASYGTRNYSLVTPAFRLWELGYYAQDDYRLRPNLTLNLGVRYDVMTPYTSHNGGFSNFDPNTGLLVAPTLLGPNQSTPTGDIKTDHGDIAPRLGFAYSIRPKVVIRGGYGITYYPGNMTSGSYMKNAPYTFSWTCGTAAATSSGLCTGGYTNPSFANGGYYLDGSMPVPVQDITLATNPYRYAGQGFSTADFNYKNSFLHQYSLNLEDDIAGNVVTLAYVGNHGDRLVANAINVNQRPYAGAAYPFTYAFPWMTGVGVTERMSNLISNYSAAQVTVARRIKNGLAANVNYTFSHNLSNAQVIDEGQPVGNCVGLCHVDSGTGTAVIVNSYARYDYGNADLDVRHNFSLTATYDLPFGASVTGPASYIVKGWTLNAIYYAHTGNPLTIQNPSGSLSGIGLGNDRPNMVAPSASGFSKGVKTWYDVTRFRAQGVGLLGNEHRNQIYGPGLQAFDFSLFKTFPIWERTSLQFRVETFNLFNSPAFSNPSTTLQYSSFGPGATPEAGSAALTSTLPSASPRQIQLALRLQF